MINDRTIAGDRALHYTKTLRDSMSDTVEALADLTVWIEDLSLGLEYALTVMFNAWRAENPGNENPPSYLTDSDEWIVHASKATR